MSIEALLRRVIGEVVAELELEAPAFTLEHPADLSHGDFACNVALILAKQAGKNPRVLAEDIVLGLTRKEIPEIGAVSVAGPGFINIVLAPAFFAQLNARIVADRNEFGASTVHAGKTILVEHSSPNLFKPFHIGHMMNNAIGESLVRLMKFSGARVKTMSFPSDISLGVAKAVWFLLEQGGMDFLKSDQFLQNKIHWLGQAYVEATKRYDADESIHVRVKEIADNLYGDVASPELEVFLTCKAINIEYFESIVAKLGSHFDSYIYESEAGVIGKELVLEKTPAVFTEGEGGAIVYIPDESQKHVNTAVFVNGQGNPTYEAKDLGLIQMKFGRNEEVGTPLDLSLFVTDHEQVPHFNVVLDAGAKIFPDYVAKSVHVSHGRMAFKGQKMSSRLGGVPVATEMIEAVAEEARARAKDKEQEGLAESIAIAAIKFAILRTKPGQNINFDPETSLSFEGDSGPYLQYTHARIQSLIEKGAALGITPAYQSGIAEASLTEIERVTAQFETVVQHAINEYAPQHIVTYLLELSRSFNSFYGANKIIDTEAREQSMHYLALAAAAAQVIKNGLNLLAITAPDRM